MFLLALRPNMALYTCLRQSRRAAGNTEKVFNALKQKQASVFYESYELLNVDLRIPSTVTGSRKTITQS